MLWWVVTSSTALVLSVVPFEPISTLPDAGHALVLSTHTSFWNLYDDVNARTSGLFNEVEWQLREKHVVWALGVVWGTGADLFHVVFPAADWGYERPEVAALQKVVAIVVLRFLPVPLLLPILLLPILLLSILLLLLLLVLLLSQCAAFHIATRFIPFLAWAWIRCYGE